MYVRVCLGETRNSSRILDAADKRWISARRVRDRFAHLPRIRSNPFLTSASTFLATLLDYRNPGSMSDTHESHGFKALGNPTKKPFPNLKQPTNSQPLVGQCIHKLNKPKTFFFLLLLISEPNRTLILYSLALPNYIPATQEYYRRFLSLLCRNAPKPEPND